MMLTLLLAAAVPTAPSALDAERAFSRDAQRMGQWAALAALADRDAVVFTPQAVWARDFLKGRKDAPRTISWTPTASYVSCDGRVAVNTGPWQDRERGQTGFFTTVWEQQNGQWHWLSHGRHTLGKPLATRRIAVVRRGSCRGRAPGPPIMKPPPIRNAAGVKPDDFGRGIRAIARSGGIGAWGRKVFGTSEPSFGRAAATQWPWSKRLAANGDSEIQDTLQRSLTSKLIANNVHLVVKCRAITQRLMSAFQPLLPTQGCRYGNDSFEIFRVGGQT